ncbi:MAG: M13 family metallopeptidase, partial [Luteibacter sp.]
FDVGALLRRLGDRTGKVVVTQPDAVAAIAKRVGDSPVQVLRDALLVGEFHAYAQFLPSRAYAIDFAFFGQTIDGSDEAESRSTRAVAFAVAAVPDEVSRPYVARYFTPETKASAEAMVKEIIAAMDRRIDRLDWMTPATRSRAHAKLAAFTAKIGYPDRWHDYRGLALKPDDLFGNALRARRWQQAWNIGKAGKPPYRWEWSSTPMTVDAFADFPMIAITFPAAILQPPFFDPHADMAVNYGGIGAVIGHELSHQFDDQGSRYDPTGRLTTWWTEADLAAFASRTDKLVRQFSAYEPLPGMHIDGRLTLGENLADLAGLYVAHDAYGHALGGKPAPDIDGFSGDQRFFLGWAQMWRYKYREADMRKRLLTNPHSPGEQRVWTMRNLDAWYPAFGVRPGQRLYLEPSQRVRVW